MKRKQNPRLKKIIDVSKQFVGKQDEFIRFLKKNNDYNMKYEQGNEPIYES